MIRQRTFLKAFNGSLLVLIVCIGCEARVLAQSHTGDYLGKSDEWFAGAEGRKVTTNILSWQDVYGNWPKNQDNSRVEYQGEAAKLKGTFDNGATTAELRYLARAYGATKEERVKESFLKGVDGILRAQYPTGGWPQSYPPDHAYHRYITFNDNAMARLLLFLRDVATRDEFAFAGTDRRQKASESFDKGIQCILKCQVKSDGVLKVWCAQHDEIDLSPRPARSYELVSLSGSESAGILELLMSLDKPGPEVAKAVAAGVGWFDRVRIKGIRVEKVNGVRTVAPDASAPDLWARFYEIETDRPFFSGRDGVKKYDFNQIETERRNGYAWYGDWASHLNADYAAWRKKWNLKGE